MNAATLLLAALLAGQRPPNHGGPPPPSPAVFDVRNYGAAPDDNVSDTAAFQAAVDWARPVKGTVYAPGGRYQFDAMVEVKRLEGVTVRGDDAATVVTGMGGYGGPLFGVGLPALARDVDPAKSRPPLLASDFDGSVPLPKWGVSTAGGMVLAVPAHPLQFGPRTGGPATGGPSNWRGPGTLTVDLKIRRTGPWPVGLFLFGTRGAHDNPLPWAVATGDRCFQVLLATEWGTQDATVPADLTATDFDLTVQADATGGKFAAWLKGRPVADVGPLRPSPLTGHDGFAPVILGGGCTGANPDPGQVAPCVVLGARVVFGPPVYRWDAPTQTLADGRAATDFLRYFDRAPAGLAGLFPLDDPPGRSWVALRDGASACCAFWTPPASWNDTKRVAFERINLQGGTQPTVLVGSHMGLRLSYVSAVNASQGLGSLPVVYSWPFLAEGCEFGGYDAAVFLHGQGVWSTMRDCSLSSSGRDGLRLVGWAGVISNLLIASPPAWAERAIDVRPVDDGVTLALERVSVDNEGGPNYPGGVVRAEQGSNAPVVLDVKDLTAGYADPGSPLVNLVGHGVNASGSYSQASRVTLTNVGVWTADPTLYRDAPGWSWPAGRPASGPAAAAPAARSAAPRPAKRGARP